MDQHQPNLQVVSLHNKAGESDLGQAAAPMSSTEPVLRFVGQGRELNYDALAIEEPLQIRLAGEDVAVAMRTPGHDIELAVGFLYTEGIIRGKHHIESISYCPPDDGSQEQNVVNVLPTDRTLLDPRGWRRNFYSTSSCGVCGKTTIAQIKSTNLGFRNSNLEFAPVPVSTLYPLPDKLRAEQEVFSRTGGLHAAGLFDLEGNLIIMREDVGRHNAVDKVIGHALLNEMLPLSSAILLVSSRASFEIVQKALTAGVPIMAVVSAPSSLAVELAREMGITLVAFLRQGRLNVYAGETRIAPPGE